MPNLRKRKEMLEELAETDVSDNEKFGEIIRKYSNTGQDMDKRDKEIKKNLKDRAGGR